jgi:hypothetical protein
MVKVAGLALAEKLRGMNDKRGAIALLAVQAGCSPSTVRRYIALTPTRGYNNTMTGLLQACGIQRGYRAKGGAWAVEDIVRRAHALNNAVLRIYERNRRK